MNLQQQERFYQMMTTDQKQIQAACHTETEAKEDTMITEVHDGLIVTRPAKKIEYLSEPAQTQQESEAQVWNLTKDRPV